MVEFALNTKNDLNNIYGLWCLDTIQLRFKFQTEICIALDLYTKINS